MALSSYAEATKLAANTVNDAGITEKNAAKYADSLSGRINTLKSSLQGLAVDSFKSDNLKVITSGLEGIVDTIDLLIKKTGLLGGLITGGSGIYALISAFKGGGRLKMLSLKICLRSVDRKVYKLLIA